MPAPTPTDAALLAAFRAVSAALAEPGQPDAGFVGAHRALDALAGVKLCTVLRLLPSGERERAYTSDAAAYPVGGRKKGVASAWGERVLIAGRPFLGRTHEEIAAVFPDHALIRSLGCGSVMNLVLRYDGRVVGTVNVLHEERWYDEAQLAAAAPVAQLVAPLLARG
jgi:hypothetical protein